MFIKMYLNIDLYLSIGILLLLSALFTIGGIQQQKRLHKLNQRKSDFLSFFLFFFVLLQGGASAVIWTDFIQVLFMLLGAVILAIISKLDYHCSVE